MKNFTFNNPRLLIGLKLLLGFIVIYFGFYFLFSDKNSEAEVGAWQEIKNSHEVKSFENYLRQYPTGKYADKANDKIIKLKQDKLNLDQALAAGTYQALEHYVNNCTVTGCINLNIVEDIKGKADKINQDFRFHLRVKNLSTGSKGYALNDIAAYKKLLPNDAKIADWQNQVGLEFIKLAQKSIKQNNLNKAEIYHSKAADILGYENTTKLKQELIKSENTDKLMAAIDDHELEPDTNDNPQLTGEPIKIKETSEQQTGDSELEKINIALSQGDVNSIKTYINECKNCELKTKAQQVLDKFTGLSNRFADNLANDRLSKGENNAARNLNELNELFPATKLYNEWAKKIADKFLSLAAKAELPGTKNIYRAKADEFIAKTKEIKLTQKPDIYPGAENETRIENALSSGNIARLNEYIASCKDCRLKIKAEAAINKFQALERKFNDNLANERLSKGENSAANNLKTLKNLFPTSALANQWSQKISARFMELAKATDNPDTRNLYEAKAKVFTSQPQTQKDSSEKNETTIVYTSQIETALAKGEIKLLRAYLRECQKCELKSKVNIKLVKYEKITQNFKDNLANDRLSKGTNNAAADLARLKQLFPESNEIKTWSQQIADQFYSLAAISNDSKTAVFYIDKGLEFALDKARLKHLKIVKTKALGVEELYAIMQNIGTISAAQDYLRSCANLDCINYAKIKDKLKQADKIIADFALHLKHNVLTKGSQGNTRDDIASLSELFPREPRLEKWRDQVMDKFVTLIDKAMAQNNHIKAQQLVVSALSINEQHHELLLRLARLEKLNPQYSRVIKATKLAPAMVYIPGADFIMGGKYRRAKPAHRVSLEPYRISVSEITFAQFIPFARENKIKLNSSKWGFGKRPVINVSWHDAVKYARWLSRKTNRKFRLPSEAEWEFAASRSPALASSGFKPGLMCKYANGADRGVNYPWKNRQCSDGFRHSSAPVASFKPNSFGLYDMYGNVWEYTQDCWHYNYRGAPTNGKAWIKKGDCRYRVIKGGGWNSSLDFMHPKYRNSAKASVRYNYVGFRIVEDL